MIAMKNRSALLLILGFLAVACGEKPEPEPEVSPAPALVSTSPADGISDVDGASLTVVFTFDQNIKCSSAAQAGISIDGGARVDNASAYSTDLTVDISGLLPGQSYVLSLPKGTVEGYRHNQEGSAAISFSFSTWKPKEDPEVWEDAASAVVNMGVGWNLGNTLDSNSGDVNNMWIEAFTDRSTSAYETAWGQPVATRELIKMFRRAGFNAIRVPVTWYPHMGTVTVSMVGQSAHWDVSTWKGYDVDPAWMARVKEVVGYVLDEGMYCILNVHHDTGEYSTSWLRADTAVHEAVKDRFCALWKQIATEFEPFGQRLIFESFNEMLDAKGTWNHSTDDAHEAINLYNADFVSTVRSTGGNNAKRNLILNTYSSSPDPESLSAFRLPPDSTEGHLMAEVHSYAPYNFAFDTNYPKEVFDTDCENDLKAIISNVNKYLVSRGIPCVLGEFGCTTKRAESEVIKQAQCYVSNATQYNIACFYWMSLSDGDDRKVPQWTKPALKDAILKAYKDNRK